MLRRPGQPRFEMSAWAPLLAHGIEPPDLQVWPCARELGAEREVT